MNYMLNNVAKNFIFYIDSPKTGKYEIESIGTSEGNAVKNAVKSKLFKDVEDKYYICKIDIMR